MGDSKSVISVYFCWRSDFTSVSAAALTFEQKEHSMCSKKEGGNAGPGPF